MTEAYQVLLEPVVLTSADELIKAIRIGGMGSGKPRQRWNRTWQGTQRITRRIL